MKPFFSIIVPVYNCQEHIKIAIESVIAQTYPSWELIIIDDGSKDNSGRICDTYCYDYRIKVVHQENKGVLASRVRGIEVAEGEYMLGLDADDWLEKDCLERVKGAIDRSGSELVFFGIRMTGAYDGVIYPTLLSEKEYTREELIKNVVETTNHSLCNKAIKLKKVKNISDSGFVEKRLSVNVDYILIIFILCNISSGYVIEDVLYNYRINKESISHSYKVENIYDTNYVTDYVLKKLKRESLLSEDMYKKVNKAYMEMISSRLSRICLYSGISREECRRIHRSHIYVNSKEFETVKDLGIQEYLVLKIFRYKQYWIFLIINKVRMNLLYRCCMKILRYFIASFKVLVKI